MEKVQLSKRIEASYKRLFLKPLITFILILMSRSVTAGELIWEPTCREIMKDFQLYK